jgi:hypothetical protein
MSERGLCNSEIANFLSIVKNTSPVLHTTILISADMLSKFTPPHYMFHREGICHYISITHGFTVSWHLSTKASAQMHRFHAAQTNRGP